MNMEDFQCEAFDIRISFTLKEFDKDGFLKAVKVKDESEYVDEDGDLFLVLSFGSRSKPPKNHAHLRILIHKDETGVATLSFHQAGKKRTDEKPPYLEESAKWLGGFFKHDTVTSRINTTYRFDKREFSTAIPLPFPLVADDKALTGLKVAGLALQYPKGHLIQHVVLEQLKTKIYLNIRQKESAIRLKKFDLFVELEKLRGTVSSLVREQEKNNGGNKKTSKTRQGL